MTHDILLKIILTAVGLLTTGALTRSYNMTEKVYNKGNK